MRRLLLVLVVVGSTLLVQSPAHAWHRFYDISMRAKGTGVSLTVETNCLPGETLRLSSTSLPGTIARRVPQFSPRRGVRQLSVSTLLVGSGSTATFRASCNRHPLSAEEPNSGVATLTVLRPGAEPSELPDTGRSTLPWLTLGLCLVLAGGLLVMLGRRERV